MPPRFDIMTKLIHGILMLALLTGCGGEPSVETIRIRITTPQLIDPSLVDSVVVAAIHEPSAECVTSVNSNTCSQIMGVYAASKLSGYLKQVTISSTSGSSTATLDGLPRGQTCFVAEARSTSGAPLGNGCADVKLTVDSHLIEIEVNQ